MKSSLLLALLALSVQSAAAQASTVKTKVKATGQGNVKAKSSPAVALAAPDTTPDADATPDEARVAARAKSLTETMRTALALTPQQVEKVNAINTTSVRNVEQARVRYRTDPRKLQSYIAAVGNTRLDAIKDVLTPAQFSLYQRKREEKMGIPANAANTGNPVPGLPTNGE
jgi:hypothetical protein